MMLFTLRQRLVIIGATVLTIAVFGGVGYLLAGVIGLFIGAVLSFPVTQAILVKQMTKEGERIAASQKDV